MKITPTTLLLGIVLCFVLFWLIGQGVEAMLASSDSYQNLTGSL